jgi:hypothetical protein
MPNAGAHLLPEADATQERTLEAVSSRPLLGLFPHRWLSLPLEVNSVGDILTKAGLGHPSLDGFCDLVRGTISGLFGSRLCQLANPLLKVAIGVRPE